jgi:hypothetical protein
MHPRDSTVRRHFFSNKIAVAVPLRFSANIGLFEANESLIVWLVSV